MKEEASSFSIRKIESWKKKVGYSYEFQSPNIMRIKLPGLALENVYEQGQRQIICSVLKTCMMSAIYWELPSRNPDEILTAYVFNLEMNVSPCLYDNSRKYPLVIENKIVNVKRSTRCYKIDIVQTEQAVPLVSSHIVEILVDRHTGKPKPYPEWWKKKYNFPTEGYRPQIEEAIRPTDGVFSTQRRVYFTDTDDNHHSNFTVYLKMCLDTFYENILHTKYPNSYQAFLNGWIQTVTMSFKQESVLGDILSIESWGDKKNLRTFHFDVRKGEAIICKLSVTFYRSLTQSRL